MQCLKCLHCQKTIHNKPWNHLTNIIDGDGINSDGINSDGINSDKYICSYVCYKRLSESNKLPKNLWPHIVNKEDYIDNINPVLPKEKEFQYLTHDEILEMNDKQMENYFKKKDEQIEYDSELTKIREDNEKEDKYIYELENNYIYTEELDDDY